MIKFNILISLLFFLSLISIYFLYKSKKKLEESLDFLRNNEIKEKAGLYKKIEEKDTEARLLKVLINALHFPIIVINKKFELVFYNQKCKEIFPNIKEDQAQSFLELSRNFELITFIESNFFQYSILYNFNFDDSAKNSFPFFNIELVPIKFTSHCILILNDVSDKRITEKMKEDFISNFSHEIRTPLTIQSGLIQNLKLRMSKEAQMSEDLLELFSKIEHNEKRSEKLFEDMLNLSKVEKKSKLDIEPIELLPMLQIIEQDILLKYRSDLNITFNFNFEENLKINGDYYLLEQVFLNLIENSIKYKNDNIVIDIDLSIDRDKKEIHLILSDNGKGIPEHLRHRVFERFFRIDQSHSSNIVGFGLGLSIVKHIIQKHKGSIKVVDPKYSPGTSFLIRLPL